MPVIKHISGVHKAPKKFMEYIADKKKTEDAKYVTGINVPEDIEMSLLMMKNVYEKYSRCSFYDKPTYDLNETQKQKESIRLHHYVQSFSPEEKLSPEEAHQIGIEWAKKVFGDKYLVVVSTHVDRGHIHNHFAVSAYSLDGKHWNDNQKTLNMCKRISDQIALEHGLTILEPKHKNTMKYYEWLSRSKGISVKQKVQMKIDELILDETVRSVDELAERLQQTGCNVRLGKYMTVQPPNSKRAYRTENLDKTYGGYSIAELEYRIANKDKEFTEEALKQFSGIQKTYAIFMRSIQITVYYKKAKKATYSDLVKSANLLTFLCENNIHSVSQLHNIVNDADERYRKKKSETEALKKRVTYLSENASEENKPFLERANQALTDSTEELNILYDERKRVSDIYRTYLQQTGDTYSGEDNNAPVCQEDERQRSEDENEKYSGTER